MSTIPFEQLPIEQQQAFRDACLAADLVPEAFTVTVLAPDTTSITDSGAGVLTVTVQYGGVAREYDAGAANAWTVDFEDDLKTHVFG